MKIKFCTSAGVPPYREADFHTGKTVLPRVGELVQEGNCLYRVTLIAYNYTVGIVFVYVEPHHDSPTQA